MNEHIFDNAKFGDHFLTRNGTEVIYWGHKIPVGRNITWHFLISPTDLDVAFYCTDDGLAVGNHTDFPEWDEDIIAKCNDEIDEDKLTELQCTSLAEDIENGVMERDLRGIYPNDDQSWVQGYAVGFERGYKSKNK